MKPCDAAKPLDLREVLPLMMGQLCPADMSIPVVDSETILETVLPVLIDQCDGLAWTAYWAACSASRPADEDRLNQTLAVLAEHLKLVKTLFAAVQR